MLQCKMKKQEGILVPELMRIVCDKTEITMAYSEKYNLQDNHNPIEQVKSIQNLMNDLRKETLQQ